MSPSTFLWFSLLLELRSREDSLKGVPLPRENATEISYSQVNLDLFNEKIEGRTEFDASLSGDSLSKPHFKVISRQCVLLKGLEENAVQL